MGIRNLVAAHVHSPPCAISRKWDLKWDREEINLVAYGELSGLELGCCWGTGWLVVEIYLQGKNLHFGYLRWCCICVTGFLVGSDRSGKGKIDRQTDRTGTAIQMWTKLAYLDTFSVFTSWVVVVGRGIIKCKLDLIWSTFPGIHVELSGQRIGWD